jgi:His-Xaa-Ser system protein HxsD
VEPDDAATVVHFDRATVELDAIQRAAYALAATMTLDIVAAGSQYACKVCPRDVKTTSADLAHLLRTEVNDQILRRRISAETAPLRDVIFALAFSQTGLVEQPPS